MVVKGSARSEATEFDSRESLARGMTLPKDIFNTLVDALAEALVEDCQQDTTRMVTSPRGRGHDVPRGST